MEVLLAFLSNFSTLALILSIGLSIAAPFVWMFGEFKGNDVQDRRAQALKKMLLALIILAFFACVPSINNLWTVRIGLIKLELASPENVKKASETIERIGQKLECKYLGCEEKK